MTSTTKEPIGKKSNKEQSVLLAGSTEQLQMYHQQLPPVIIKGYKFFNSLTGENILIKGIDYYPRPNAGPLDVNSHDYFTEEYRHIWQRDIPHFQELGINAVRLYSVDPNKDHSAFMCALDAAGIYALVELASGSCPKCAILSDKAPKCYPPFLKTRGELIIREFSKYTNTLAFSAGNEVNHYVPLGMRPQWNAPCLKKFVRDMRAFAQKCESTDTSQMRHVPIGLIMADSDRDENTLYYNCQDDAKDELGHAEWYGINTYVYCDGNATKFDDAVGFKTLLDSFASYHYSIPTLLTEFGCLDVSFPTVDGYQAQRTFHQAQWFNLPVVQDQFAGGMAFEYSMEKANAGMFPYKEFGKASYGIGYFAPEQCNDVDILCEYKHTPSFDALKDAYSHAHAMKNVTFDTFEPEQDRIRRSQCPSDFPKLSSFHWRADYRWSIRCPSKSSKSLSSDGVFICPSPAPQSNGGTIRVPSSLPASHLSSLGPLSQTLFWSCFVAMIYFLHRALRNFFTPGAHAMSALPSDFWLPYKETDNDDDNTGDENSEETLGLILTNNSSGHGYYSSMDSGSSSGSP